LTPFAKKVQLADRPAGDPAPHKSKFFKVYKAPGYPIDPKCEKERLMFVPAIAPGDSPVELCRALHRRMSELCGYKN
jgi:hypothetical protein